MKLTRKSIMFFVSLLLIGSVYPQKVSFKNNLKLGTFGAFYTKLESGQAFEKYSRTWSDPDIVVDLGKYNEMFVFWRGTSYLPIFKSDKGEWKVDEMVKRQGDGTTQMPDRTNALSHVKIIKSGLDEVVVHWRYLPEFTRSNPQKGVNPDKFVEEYFYIHPGGKVKRTIRQGTSKIEDWYDPDNIIVETFTLTETGIINKKIIRPNRSSNSTPSEGSEIVTGTIIKPAAWWKLDEAEGDKTVESVGGESSRIAGPKSMWRKGISGTALQFDGYNTKIELTATKAPKLKGAVTFEGWVALGAYPWSDVPIIQQCDDVPEKIKDYEGHRAVLTGETDDQKGEKGKFKVEYQKENDRGYFLGLNGYGNPELKLRVGDKWEVLTSKFHLERRKWYHIAATYDKSTGSMKIYVNGNPEGEKSVAETNIELSKKNLKIGHGKMRRPINPVRKNTFPASYSLDGLMDELKVYDTALTPEQIKKEYELYNPSDENLASVDMDKRVLPEGINTEKFGAHYTFLKYYEAWDNLWRFGNDPDVVVDFDDQPSKFVFWHGVSYIPMMVNDKGQWYSNEFNETWNKSGGNGCQEPMSDKGSYYSHVKIIENTPARIVVEWRFPLLDVNHVLANYDPETGWCDWSDWYYYIYPDGMAVKDMRLYTNGERNHEWQESMAIFGPDQRPEQIINTKDALTMVSSKGDYKSYDWVNGPPDNVKIPDNKIIQYINYTGNYKPVTIGDFTGANVYNGEVTNYAVFPTWNHWPVAQIPSDGRYASFPDRTSHSSLTHVFLPIYKEVLEGPKPYYEKILMEGMLKKQPVELIPLAKSWLQYPKISELKGADGQYSPGERAYVLNTKSNFISFLINLNENSPMVNVCIVLKGWDDKGLAKVTIDSKPLDDKNELRQGLVRDVDGTKTLIIWIQKSSMKPVQIEIKRMG